MFTRYLPEEIRAAWQDKKGQGHRQAVQRGRDCVVVKINDENAVVLAALFIRCVFAIPTCTHYNGKTLSLYCGDSGSGVKACLAHARGLVQGYFRSPLEGPDLFSSD